MSVDCGKEVQLSAKGRGSQEYRSSTNPNSFSSLHITVDYRLLKVKGMKGLTMIIRKPASKNHSFSNIRVLGDFLEVNLSGFYLFCGFFAVILN